MTHRNDKSMTKAQQTIMVVVEEKPDLTIDGELNLPDYIQDVEPTEKTKTDMRRWAEVQRETTRTRLAMTLVRFFGGSLVATFALVGVVAFSPNADKAFIKDVIPKAINPQVALLGGSLVYYFGAKNNKK